MDDKEKAKEIAYNDELYGDTDNNSMVDECYIAALEMAAWKNEQLWLIINAIDHAYLKTDGTYGDLSYEVSDKIRYLKSILK